jgi:hypothetical protein
VVGGEGRFCILALDVSRKDRVSNHETGDQSGKSNGESWRVSSRRCCYKSVAMHPSLYHHRVQNGFGAHPASYPMGTRGSFPGGKAAGAEADHSPPRSAEVKE